MSGASPRNRGAGVVSIAVHMKTCSHCSETVRAEARKCPFCSFRFDVTPATWPATLRVLAIAMLGGAAAIGLVMSPLLVVPQLALAAVLLGLGQLGARANRRAQFRATGPVRRLERTTYCCPACSPIA
jgi:hypothetical protein